MLTDQPERILCAEMIREKIGDCEISFQVVDPTTGSHCGPDGVGVTFHAKHR